MPSTPADGSGQVAAPTQVATAPPEQDPSTSPDIVVTAQRRAETLQSIPIAISAKSGEDLERRGATNFGDYLNTVPGVNFKDLGPGINELTIRGASGGQTARDETQKKPGVGVYLDEAPISLALFNPDLDYYDVERVEVLRGPQGTLFGSGSLSGTVRVIARKPDASRIGASVEGNLSQVEGGGTGYALKAMINVPLSDSVAIRAVGYGNRYPGFIDTVPLVTPNLGTLGSARQNVNSGSKVGGRIALRAESGSLTATLSGTVQHIKANGLPLADIYNVNVAPITGLSGAALPKVGTYQRYLPTPDGNDDTFYLANATLEYHLDAFNVVSSSSYIDRTIETRRDETLRGINFGLTTVVAGDPGASGPKQVYFSDNNKNNVFTQEVRLVSNGDGRFQWIVGGFYERQNKSYNQYGLLPGLLQYTGVNSMTKYSDPRLDSAFDYLLGIQLGQKAGFADISYKLTDTLKADAGVRVFQYTESRDEQGRGYFYGGTGPRTISTGSNKGASPRFVLTYTPDRNLLFSGQASRGFRLGSVNPSIPNTSECNAAFAAIGERPKSSYDPETLWNYEFNAKTSFLNRRLTVNTAVYHSDYSDIQLSGRVDGCAGGLVFTSNGGKAQIDGQELEIAARLVGGLDLSLAAAHTNARFSSALPTSITAALGPIRKGDPLPNSPEWTVSASGTYEKPVSDRLNLYLFADYSFVDRSFSRVNDLVNPNLLNGGWLEAYSLVNARVGLRADRDWDVSVYINNLTNKAAQLALDVESSGAGRQSYVRNAPRTFGLTARKFF